MERARRSVWCLSTYSLTSYLLTYLRPASRGQRGLPHLLQRGRTAGHLAPHALARPGTPSMVRLPSWWRHGSLAWPPGATPSGSWLRHALGTHSGRAAEPRRAQFPARRRLWPKVADSAASRAQVPHLPLRSMGFAHIGTEVWWDERWRSGRVCDGSGEDASCADSVSCMRHACARPRTLSLTPPSATPHPHPHPHPRPPLTLGRSVTSASTSPSTITCTTSTRSSEMARASPGRTRRCEGRQAERTRPGRRIDR